MKIEARETALSNLQKMAKKLMAEGYGDDECAGEKLISDAKSGNLEDHAEDDDNIEEVAEAGEEEGEEGELTDEEKEVMEFLGKGSESPMAAGQTRMVFQIAAPKKAGRGKA